MNKYKELKKVCSINLLKGCGFVPYNYLSVQFSDSTIVMIIFVTKHSIFFSHANQRVSIMLYIYISCIIIVQWSKMFESSWASVILKCHVTSS